MLKKLTQRMLLFYFSFMLIMASISIPFAKHTCHISQLTTYNVFSYNGLCSVDENTSCHGESLKASKDSCCDLNIGILNLKVDLNASQINSISPFVVPAAKSSLKQHLVRFTSKQAWTSKVLYAPPLQILFQVFRC